MHAHRYDISDIPFASILIETGNWGVNTFACPPRIRERIRRRRRNGLGGNLARFQLSDTEPERKRGIVSFEKYPFPGEIFQSRVSGRPTRL